MFPIRSLLCGLALLSAAELVALAFKTPVVVPSQGTDLSPPAGQIPKVTDRFISADYPPIVTASVSGSDAMEADLLPSPVSELATKKSAEVSTHRASAARHVTRAAKPVSSKGEDAFAFSDGPSQNYKYKPAELPTPNFTNSAY
jgi:hypothetical protein